MLYLTICELNLFSDFVNRELHLHPELLHEFLLEKPLNERKKDFALEGRKILETIKNYSCKPLKKSYRKQYRRTHVQECLDLTDRLQRILLGSQLNNAATCMELYRVLLIALEEMLRYFIKSCQYDFELDFYIPYAQHLELLDKMGEASLRLRACFRHRDVDLSLQQVLLDEITAFCNFKVCSYRELYYMQDFAGAMTGLMQEDGHENATSCMYNWTKKLRDLMIYWNFNSPGFIEHTWTIVTVDLDRQEDLPRQYLQLKWHWKEMEKLSIRDDIYHMKGASFIQEMRKRFKKERKYIVELQGNPETKVDRINFTARAEAEEWITKQEAMVYLLCSDSTFYREWRKNQGLWKDKKVKGIQLFKKSSLFLSRNTKNT